MKNYNHQEGFTLLEVMIAIFVLTIGILGAAAMQVASIDGNSKANNLTEAATWGGDMLETLMNLPYKDADLEDTRADGFAGLNKTDEAGNEADFGPVDADPRGNFTMFWNVAENYPIFGTKTIRVHIRRSDLGVQKTIAQDFIMMEKP